jgi:2-hydroxychromene-2-carboxylate isomerase
MKPNNVLVNAVLAAVVAAATADQKLFSEPGKADKDKALRIANELGLDIDQLQKDTEDPDIKKALDETRPCSEARSEGHAHVPDWR